MIRIDGNGNAVTTVGGNVYGSLSTIANTAPNAAARADRRKDVILFAAADPGAMVPLRLGEEAREILAALGDRFDFQQRTAVRPRDFTAALTYLHPRIVHFSGHGEADGSLCFEDDAGAVHPVSPEALGLLFSAVPEFVECVVLNACWSEEQARHIARSIAYVVGMRREIGDKAAVAFSVGFYQAIAGGLSVPSAYAAGRAQVAAMNIPEHLTPVLLCRDAKP